MMTVETIGRIRREHFVKGKRIRRIAGDLRVSRQTVRKAITAGGTESRYRRGAPQGLPQLGALVTRLEELLAANAERSRRERLTWRRIFEVLRSEGYAGGCDSVRRSASALSARRGARVHPVRYLDKPQLPQPTVWSTFERRSWSTFACRWTRFIRTLLMTSVLSAVSGKPKPNIVRRPTPLAITQAAFQQVADLRDDLVVFARINSA